MTPPAADPPGPLVCMDCGRPAHDARGGIEFDRGGDVWVYCRACDVWTSHPPERLGLARAEVRRGCW